ncbi:hypothetical protein HLB44_32520 [Aquincola sp. S2]|uniref:Uncharacterized protein n=1 Tax=Pseudaquabacterium terrae TaxID=2732868 RepID=A0ABX2ESY9_9BURK|nr:hypothetical protein [Aquabacterium terrae]NRF71723.1 hypothetical protein [Aquabacterium terrae]
MNGYLSRIAKQSGLKYQAPRPEARALPAAGPVEVPAAPELERTVMVRADSPQTEVSSAPESKGMQRAQPPLGPERGVDAARTRESGAQAGAARVATGGEPNQPAAATPEAAPAREPLEGGLRTELPDAPARDRAAGEPRLVELTHLVESTPSETAPARPAQADVARHAELETDSADRRAPLAEPKQHFTRTAELLGNHAALTPELQTVVFREVQEWVAASPQAQRLERDAPTSAPRLLDATQARAPEAAAAREDGPRDAPDRAQPIEQQFDLSIGTINVTIEEPETPRRPDSRPRQPERAARDDSAHSSRLGRSYL